MKRKLKIWICIVSLVSSLAAAYILIACYNAMNDAVIYNRRLKLTRIEVAKQQWADEKVHTTNDTPTLDDIRPYLGEMVEDRISWTNGQVVDLDGAGIYTIGRVGELPSCLIGSRRVYPLP